MPYNYANGTVSDTPPFMAFEVFPRNSDLGGFIYSKKALDGLIEAYCGKAEMQVMAAKWRILALLGNEYKSLSFKRQLLMLSNRTDDPLWDNVIRRMTAIDELSREYSIELTGEVL